MSTPSKIQNTGRLSGITFRFHSHVNFTVRANTDKVNNVVTSRCAGALEAPTGTRQRHLRASTINGRRHRLAVLWKSAWRRSKRSRPRGQGLAGEAARGRSAAGDEAGAGSGVTGEPERRERVAGTDDRHPAPYKYARPRKPSPISFMVNRILPTQATVSLQAFRLRIRHRRSIARGTDDCTPSAARPDVRSNA
jgi:hypothetical protein